MAWSRSRHVAGTRPLGECWCNDDHYVGPITIHILATRPGSLIMFNVLFLAEYYVHICWSVRKETCSDYICHDGIALMKPLCSQLLRATLISCFTPIQRRQQPWQSKLGTPLYMVPRHHIIN